MDNSTTKRPITELRDGLVALVFVITLGAVIGVLALAFFQLVTFASHYWGLSLSKDLQADWHYSPTLGVSLLVTALVAGQLLRFIKDHRPQGPADLIQAAQQNQEPDLKNGFRSSLLALNNLCGGASVGIFGPLVHFGGCLSALFFKAARRIPENLVLGAGAGAAIAAVFSAPLGATIFAYEVIIRRFGSWGVALLLASSFAAFWTAEQVLGGHRLFSVSSVPNLNVQTVVIAFGVGIACGLASIAYIYLVTKMPTLAKKSRLPITLRPLVPATLIFVISPLLPHVVGLGLDTISMAMAGQLALSLLLALIVGKIVLTSICMGFGYFGGVFSPALFYGAMIGAVVDLLLGSGQAVTEYALLGAASSIACVIGAPIASIVIVLEITGSYEWAALSAMSVAGGTLISNALIGRSLFDRQLSEEGQPSGQ